LVSIQWVGTVPHGHIAETYRNSHLLFSADINAACPNSVIEAMACGTPVLSFDTGALRELLVDKGGIVVPYGGNPWELDPPDIQSLTEGALEVLNNIERYRVSAREQANNNFDVEKMVDRYVDILLG
jgi:glycosyltransferase involved in cell wall biosynthesis